MPVSVPASLHPETQSLVLGFSAALAEKLAKAEAKYGYTDGWQETAWIESGECRRKLVEHTAKGDPRDVAAYCAFLWYHGASTTPDANPKKSAFERLTFAGKREGLVKLALIYLGPKPGSEAYVTECARRHATAILSLIGEVQK